MSTNSEKRATWEIVMYNMSQENEVIGVDQGRDSQSENGRHEFKSVVLLIVGGFNAKYEGCETPYGR